MASYSGSLNATERPQSRSPHSRPGPAHPRAQTIAQGSLSSTTFCRLRAVLGLSLSRGLDGSADPDSEGDGGDACENACEDVEEAEEDVSELDELVGFEGEC
jgi:hypothetical protein